MNARTQEPLAQADKEARPLDDPSALFEQYRPALATHRAKGPIIDLACGRGRHALEAASSLGPVIAVDRNRTFLDELGSRSRRQGLTLARLQTDLETDFGIPLKAESAGAILVFRYLHRPLAQSIEALLAPGGLLLYETFTIAQAERPSGPSRPEFLLRPGELRSLFPGLEVLHYAESEPTGKLSTSEEAVAQLVARKRG